ncbi:MAG: DUF3137 domain-containing protein [bacterium]
MDAGLPAAQEAHIERMKRLQLLGGLLGGGAAVAFVGALISLLTRLWPLAIVAGLGFIGLLVAAIVVAFKAAAARTLVWQDFAARHGWTYTQADASDRPSRFLGFQPFGQGHGRRATDVIEGDLAGVHFETFTYQYTVTSGSGKNRHETTYYNTVVASRMPIDGHNLTMSRETVGKKIFDALGGEDIDTESDEFSRAFWVKCDDRRFAYDVLTPAMMQHLLAIGTDGTWQWRGPWLVREITGRLRLEEVEGLASQVQGFAAKLPRQRIPQAAASPALSPTRPPRSR